MGSENMIDITGVDLVKCIQAVYDLSVPQGMGHLHYREGGLTDEEAKSLINDRSDRIAVSMDYVKGRACKFVVHRESASEKLFINDRWFDHSKADLEELLSRIGVTKATA